ncbi:MULTISPECIES: Gfo/Idh/MocA family protein [Planktothricoides]|uniref:Gfo/Idh/MocA family oxidoreductase n=2 Tax=Planktothricoides raciborskii TaxID=132608 RepID=A0AAU8JGT3_9CYAN|nr:MULTISPECIES: Gfo/Idh/MocA family oxidoreductase [Planktothricoides]KOR37686.1 oxidoreductase [Planktothricoides sp. SR001]MBD2544119.1 Gfo/Idh/MocA family oxidoreductase [Planktothricoides raciborskii FACHB-1370]MBD2582604.1 Gfo/Idh/MocA family oxidoreductase [Planktothricoides raciborskii FACHB-1261]
MTTKTKFGLVGAGAIAQAYAQAFEASETAELVGVADLRTEAAQALGERLGCPSYESYQAMGEASELDAVIICTPPVTHEAIAIHFLESQIPVLCEKPLSIDLASARRMVDAAQKAGVKLTMASKFRYVEDVIKAKSIVSSGILGEIVLFENAFTSRVDMSSRWNAKPEISGGGVLIDNGTHSIDIMRYFLGRLAEVQVVEAKRIQGLPVEDTVRIFAKSVSGVVGNIDLSWSINKELDYYIRIYGSQGTISVGWQESKYRQSYSKDWIKFGNGYDKVQAFRSQIENFAKGIKDEENLLINHEDALASVEVIEAAYAALENSKWTKVGHQENIKFRIDRLQSAA